MAQLMVQLAPDVAAGFSKGVAGTTPLHRVLEELGVTLEPLVPGIDDPHLARYFQATVPSAAEAAKVASRLTGVPGVTAAYMQPPIGLP
jgi:hypothetical protein